MDVVQKRKPGRPHHEMVYKPEYCEAIVSHMEQGKSILSFAASIRVNRSTIYEWKKTHPEFKTACEVGEMLAFAWWEQESFKGLWEETEYDEKGRPQKTKRLNTTLLIYHMKARFGFGVSKKPIIAVNNNTTTVIESEKEREVLEMWKNRVGKYLDQRNKKEE